jgi:hypothetical protein
MSISTQVLKPLVNQIQLGVTFPRPGHSAPIVDQRDQPELLLAIDPLIRTSANPQRKLFLVPTPTIFEGEENDPLSAPQPSPLAELPPVTPTVERYVLGVVEIWGGRRPAMQLARSSHRQVFQKLLTLAGHQPTVPRIRKIYIHEPIEGVIETSVTLRFGERVRCLVLRFEGVDKRWLCTELHLL